MNGLESVTVRCLFFGDPLQLPKDRGLVWSARKGDVKKSPGFCVGEQFGEVESEVLDLTGIGHRTFANDSFDYRHFHGAMIDDEVSLTWIAFRGVAAEALVADGPSQGS
jgi:hypothetical protein